MTTRTSSEHSRNRRTEQTEELPSSTSPRTLASQDLAAWKQIWKEHRGGFSFCLFFMCVYTCIHMCECRHTCVWPEDNHQCHSLGYLLFETGSANCLELQQTGLDSSYLPVFASPELALQVCVTALDSPWVLGSELRSPHSLVMHLNPEATSPAWAQGSHQYWT